MVGFELEWLTHPIDDPARRVTSAELRAVTDGLRLPYGGTTSIEPGGQIELSTRPSPSLASALEAAVDDARVLRTALGNAGITTRAEAVDRDRDPARVVHSARYDAMESYFDAMGDAGRTMMCNTASLQVNVDPAGDPCAAWRALAIAAPLLPALFSDGQEPSRQAIWSDIDATRTTAVGHDDVGDDWATYALAARVMFIRRDAERCDPLFDGMTFGQWIDEGHAAGWPTPDDLAEHLTTLFPPVRPRGFLELRTLDALPDDRWPLAASIAAALVLDERTALDVATAATSLTAADVLDVVQPGLSRLGIEPEKLESLTAASAYA